MVVAVDCEVVIVWSVSCELVLCVVDVTSLLLVVDVTSLADVVVDVSPASHELNHRELRKKASSFFSKSPPSYFSITSPTIERYSSRA